MANPLGIGGAKKGEVRNPHGRPRVPEIELIRQAMAEVEVTKKKSLWKHLVEQAYEDNNVLTALSKKFVPDMTHIDGEIGHKIIEIIRADGKTQS